jgi:hypothetical protein
MAVCCVVAGGLVVEESHPLKLISTRAMKEAKIILDL